MTEIRAMLRERGSMPLNDFRAAACAMIPAEATRYGRVSRASVVRVWLTSYRRCIQIRDGVIYYCKAGDGAAQQEGKRGAKMLAILKANGRISCEESGFKKATWNSYSRALRRLKWVTRDSTGVLIWCGPIDAEWALVTRENSGRKDQAAE